MRKSLLVVTMLLMSQGLFGQNLFGLWAQPAPNLDWGTEISAAEVSRFISLLEAKEWRQKSDLFEPIAVKVPLNTRYAVYEKYKTYGAWGLLNVYGLGSVIQGDPGTSLVMVGGVVAGEAIVISTTLRMRPGNERTMWAVTGGVIAASAYVYGLVRPWFFAEEQNRSLKAALFEAP